MNDDTHKLIHFSHSMDMSKEWRYDFVEKLGGEFINPRELILPKSLADGCSYFMEVMPGLNVLIVDFVFYDKIEITKIPSSDDFCIAYYDIGDQISIHKINNKKHKVGYHSKLGMGVIDASLQSTYIPPVSERMYSFRLLISKALLKKYLGDIIPLALLDKTFSTKKNTIFFYSHIDSATRVLLLKLKKRNYKDASYELHLKGVALQAFNSLITRMRESEIVIKRLNEKDVQSIMKTQLYLMEHLLEKFPGIDFLVEMAGMSATKYSKLFKKIFKCTPNAFFLQEKFLLAHELVISGKFKNISEVAYELGYKNSEYFSVLYKERTGNLPSENFISSNSSQ